MENEQKKKKAGKRKTIIEHNTTQSRCTTGEAYKTARIENGKHKLTKYNHFQVNILKPSKKTKKTKKKRKYWSTVFLARE